MALVRTFYDAEELARALVGRTITAVTTPGGSQQRVVLHVDDGHAYSIGYRVVYDGDWLELEEVTPDA